MSAICASNQAKACTFRVLHNEPVCREHLRLTLSAPEFAPAEPGQFVHLGPHGRAGGPAGQPAGDGAGLIPARPFLRRAFSIGGLRRAGGRCEIDLIYRVVGAATGWMSDLEVGDSVDGLGPLGSAFGRPPATSAAYLVAGGAGLPPLQWFARELHAAGYQVVLFLGARSGDLIALEAAGQDGRSAVDTFPGSVVLATDDGSLGFSGTVVQAFEAYAADRHVDGRNVTVYTCGPEVMMREVARYCRAHAVPCFVCAERAMACGIGTCQSCVVPVKDAAAPDGWRYALCCSEGPVFDAARVLWDPPVG